MPLMLHNAADRESLKSRLEALRPDAPRQWGKMSIDQMLWHVRVGMDNPLGRFPIAKAKVPPLPKFLFKFIVFNLPWGKGNTPTAAELIAKGDHDFEAERTKLLQAMDDVAAKPIDGSWPDSPFLGTMSGKDWSRLMAKHVDHHLKQFNS